MWVVNILHLTDLHFRRAESPGAMAHRSIVLRALLDHLPDLFNAGREARDPNWRLTQQNWMPDIIAISGDLAYSGHETEYKEVRTFLAEMREKLGRPDLPIVACPGNHDRNGTYAAGLSYPKSSVQADDWLSIERQQPDWPAAVETKPQSEVAFSKAFLTAPFREFQEFCRNTKNDLVPSGIAGLEYLTGCADWLDGEYPVEFLTVNSAWFSDHRSDSDARNLWLGLPMLEWLQYRRPKRPATIRVTLVHHPREWLHEEECNSYGDRPNTYRLLAESSDLILSGHVHGSLEPPSAAYGSAIVATGGASYIGGRWRNNLSLLQLNLRDRTVARRGFEYDPRETAWVESIRAQTIRSLPTSSGARALRPVPADATVTASDLAGNWHTFFWIEGRPDVSKWRNDVVLKTLEGGRLFGESKGSPDQQGAEQKKYFLQGELGQGYFTGTWISRADPSDRTGAFQFKVVSRNEMRGRWIGFDRRSEVNVGQWVFQRTTGADNTAENS